MSLSIAMALALVLLNLLSQCSTAEDFTRVTIQLSVILYTVSLFVMLIPRDMTVEDYRRRVNRLRWLWTAAFMLYLAHVGLAFHYFHHWSHAAAYEHVAQAGGIGIGLYLNYAFTIIWAADVATWWWSNDRYVARRTWIKSSLHGFMLFMVFNGAVLFASGKTRWISLLAFGLLGVQACARLIATPAGAAENRAAAVMGGWVLGGILGLLPGSTFALHHGPFDGSSSKDLYDAAMWGGSITGSVVCGFFGLYLHRRHTSQLLANRS